MLRLQPPERPAEPAAEPTVQETACVPLPTVCFARHLCRSPHDASGQIGLVLFLPVSVRNVPALRASAWTEQVLRASRVLPKIEAAARTVRSRRRAKDEQ